MNRTEAIEEIIDSIHAAKREMLRAAVMQGFAKEVGKVYLTPSEWGITRFLARHEESTVKEIAAALQISSSAATQLIDHLIEKKMAVRKVDSEDHRSSRISLSKESKKQSELFKQTMLRHFEKHFAALSDDELETYRALQKKIAQASALIAHPKNN